MDWQVAFDDTGIMGLLITALYFLAFVLSVSVVLADSRLFGRKRKIQSLFWWIVAAVMLFMLINKQLDLQTLFIRLGKSIFIYLDLYEVRKGYQRLFALGFVIVLAYFLGSLLFKLLPVIKKHVLAMLGLLLLSIYIVVRMFAFNRITKVFGDESQAVLIQGLFELGGVILILLNAAILLRRLRNR